MALAEKMARSVNTAALRSFIIHSGRIIISDMLEN